MEKTIVFFVFTILFSFSFSFQLYSYRIILKLSNTLLIIIIRLLFIENIFVIINKILSCVNSKLLVGELIHINTF
jgi:hypothetical protein